MNGLEFPVPNCQSAMVIARQVDYTLEDKKYTLPAMTILTKNIINKLMQAGVDSVQVLPTPDTIVAYEEDVLKKKTKQKQAEERANYQELRDSVNDIFDEIAIEQRVTAETLEAAVQLFQENSQKDRLEDILTVINGTRCFNEYMLTHAINTTLICAQFGRWMRFEQQDLKNIICTSLLHDTGMTAVPEDIRRKPSSLTDQEYDIVKSHVSHSAAIAKTVKGLDPQVIVGIEQHHEKMNGTGYPGGVVGEQIHMYARIVTIADIYDAFATKKRYRKEKTPFYIFGKLSRDRYSGRDYTLVGKFLDRVSNVYVGEKVRLNDGREGVVIFVNPRDYERPFVEVDGEVISLYEKRDLEITEMIYED